MNYKTILVHISDPLRSRERVELAAKLAIASEAHLIGSAPSGVSPFLMQTSVLPEYNASVAEQMNQMRKNAERNLAAFESIAQGLGVASFEKRLVDDEASEGIVLQSRYADLVVIGQQDPAEKGPFMPPDFAPYVVHNCARPVLVVPYTGHFETVGTRVLIGWDASLQATRTITAALPLLKHAGAVDLALFNPSPYEHGDIPGADIALYLARHGVKVQVLQRQTRIDIGASLLSLAADLNSDLIVMGGYAHSRFRDIMLGGATRTMLEAMTVPVLMSH